MIGIVARLVMAVMVLSAAVPGFAQTPISTFEQVVGTWLGATSQSNLKVTITLDNNGRYSVNSLMGSETGQASLKDGAILIDGVTKFELKLAAGPSLVGAVTTRTRSTTMKFEKQ